MLALLDEAGLGATDNAASDIQLPLFSAWPSDTQRRAFLNAGPIALNNVLDSAQRLVSANESRERQLLAALERLQLVHDIARSVPECNSPSATENTLLRRYAQMLSASAVLIDGEVHCTRLPFDDGHGCVPVLTPGHVRARLGPEIDEVRQTRRAQILSADVAQQRGLGNLHVLLTALEESSQTPQVVIALRDGAQPVFSESDLLAAETIVTYAGHVLRSASMVQRLQQASLETVGALANAIEARDKYTGGHSARVGWLAVLTGSTLRLSESDLQMLDWSGRLHDVGKIGIPERILNKPGPLTAEEFAQIKRHPRLGYDVLRPVSSLGPVLDAVLYHHENHDGSGYPDGLRGNEIPLLARILHVVDIFDALTSTRSYRKGLIVNAALDELSAGAGRITDPEITRAFVTAFRDYMRRQGEDFHRRFPHC